MLVWETKFVNDIPLFNYINIVENYLWYKDLVGYGLSSGLVASKRAIFSDLRCDVNRELGGARRGGSKQSRL